MVKFLLGILLLVLITGYSQSTKNDNWKNICRASATKINDLVNTKLDVSFDYSKSWMYGKA